MSKTKISSKFKKQIAIVSYENMHSHLPFVFNECLEKAENPDLRKDIEVSMECIHNIETSLGRKHFTQGCRTYFQVDIDRLSEILQKTSMSFRIGFWDYMKLRNPNIKRDISQRLHSASAKSKKLEGDKRLRTPCFMPYIKDTGSNMRDVLDDKVIRNRLTLGIFDYLQRLMLSNCQRLKRCDYCYKWFYANKSNAKTCSLKCRNDMHAKNERGRAKRKKYMREYRKRVAKKGKKRKGSQINI